MIHLRVPSIPISVDHAYETQVIMRNKKRVATRRLSSKGKKYKAEFRAHIVKTYPAELNFFQENHAYIVLAQFTFQGRDSLYNSTWLEEDPKKRAKSRYKRLDVSNRTKLFEDALAEASGIDDKHNFFVGVYKSWSMAPDHTDIWVFDRDKESENPIDALFTQLRDGAAQSH